MTKALMQDCIYTKEYRGCTFMKFNMTQFKLFYQSV